MSALSVLGLSGCAPASRGRGAAASSPMSTASPSAAPVNSGPGYGPGDPVGVLRAALDRLRAEGAGSVEERRSFLVDGVGDEALVEYRYDVAQRAMTVAQTVWPDGTALTLHFALLGDQAYLRAPMIWEQPPGTWYEVSIPQMTGLPVGQWLESGEVPSGAVQALAGATTPAWLAVGDEWSPELTYELALPGSSALLALPPQATAMIEENGVDVTHARVPVSVTITRGGRLVAASMALGDVLWGTVPRDELDAMQGVSLEAPVEVKVFGGRSAPLELPDDPAAALPASRMPAPVPDVVGA
ncbi:hypothetical protein [Thalassiella azotivora]